MSVVFKKWDVVLLSYPFSDLSTVKVRPAVVVSPDGENRKQEDSMFLLITSNTVRLSPFDLIVEPTHPEFAGTGLSRPSAIRVNKMCTLKNTLVRRVLGELGPLLQKHLLRLLGSYFELPDTAQ